jgi:hypothetical protein
MGEMINAYKILLEILAGRPLGRPDVDGII